MPEIEKFKNKVEMDLAVCFYDSGIDHADQGNFIQSIADFTKVIQLNPSVPEAYYNRGIAYYKAGNLVLAIADFTKVIELNPTNPATYHNRAVMYYQLKEFDRAWGDVRKAEELGAKVNPEFIQMLKEATGK
jgi:tetratricopeptide (TPR) repeat protein